MLEPNETRNDSFESRMGAEDTKTRRMPVAVIVAILLIALGVGASFAIERWLESGDALSAVITGAAWAGAIGLTITTTGASGQCRRAALVLDVPRLGHETRRGLIHGLPVEDADRVR